MKKIGRGWQYTTYDIENGRVRKIFNTKVQAYRVFLRECFPYTDYPFSRFPILRNELHTKAVASIAWMSDTTLSKYVFANPTILNETDYEQDLVTPLSQYLKTVPEDVGKEVIDSFIELNKYLISHNVIDKSFLIGKNYGINKDGRVVLIDIGELFTDPQAIKDQVALQPWDHPYVTSTIPKNLRSYFVEQMNTRLL